MGKYTAVFAPKIMKFHFKSNELIMFKQSFSLFNVVASFMNCTVSNRTTRI